MAKTAGLLVAAGAALAAVLFTSRPAHAAIHHAALVIQHSGGRVLSRCVAFAEDQISGLQLIQRSGVTYQAQSFGALGSAVCQLDGEPSAVPANCFGTGPYWQYFHRRGSTWQPSAQAASASMVHDGDMDGWRFADGAAQPPVGAAFSAVCAPLNSPTAPLPRSAAPRPAQTAPASTAATLVPTPVATPGEPATTPSPTGRSGLPQTGPGTPPPSGPAISSWFLLGGAALLLIGLGGINLLRRRP